MEYRIILAGPRNPDNIGAAARAMANFGIRELALVNAFDSDWKEAAAVWRREASVSAIGAMNIIESAKLYSSIPEAAQGCGLLLATSSLHRLKPERDVIPLSGAAAYAASRGVLKTAVLFGPEKTGLTHEDLSLCSAIINIPTLPAQPSMNLGQAVAVACYELSGLVRAQPPAGRRRAPAASTAEIDRVAGEISRLLTRKKGRHWAGAAQLRAIRQSLTDARLTKGAMFALKTLLKGNEEQDEK